MELHRFSHHEEMSQFAFQWLLAKLGARTQSTKIFVPAGRTPMRLYELMEAAHNNSGDHPILSSPSLRLLQIDDIAVGKQKGLFHQFFIESLPSFQNRFVPITNANEHADLSLLGFGINGHVAFHEPGLANNFRGGCVRLSEKTCRTLNINPEDANSSWGITYGAGSFINSDEILLMVSGESKRESFERFLQYADAAQIQNHEYSLRKLNETEDNLAQILLSLPALLLCRHPRLCVVSDI